MEKNLVLIEAKRLHALGFAIIWIKPKSKMPVESGWTTGPRTKWSHLERTYRLGFNLGVRLGKPSQIDGKYLAAVDVDVKSSDPRHLKEALQAVGQLVDKESCPYVRSGRGNGSRHYYVLSRAGFKTYTPFRSEETVRAHIPSKNPSRRERSELTKEEIAKGIRLSPAWEVSLYSDGRQVVLPPSVHPDSGKNYRWVRDVKDQSLPLFVPKIPDSSALSGARDTNRIKESLKGFEVVPVELDWLDISDAMRNAIVKGEHAGIKITDRSAFLMKAVQALLGAGLTQNEVLSVLTEKKYFLGEAGYDHAKTSSRGAAANWVYKYSFRKVEQEKEERLEVFKSEPVEPRTLSKEEIKKAEKAHQEMRHWTSDLIRNKTGAPAAHLLQNAVLVLENAIPKATIKRDTFAYRDAYSRATPWGGKKGEHVSDDDVAKIKYWIGKEYGFEPSSGSISDALIVVATQNSFDPVRDFLEALPEWDGKKRLDTWLAKYFEAKGDPDYLGQVFRKWMVAMVARVYSPGAKFDWMPILEGAQDAGKSSFGKILVGDKYFTDWLPALSDKDAALGLQGMWGVEFGELTQFRKNELEIIKAFVSRTVDKVRPPYGRRVIEHERRCVFFGTTNKETYLIDETGNRRFKPMVVGKLNFKALERDRLQLFSEAKFLWESKEETEFTLGKLTEKAALFESKIHGNKMVSDDSNVMMELMLDTINRVENEGLNFDLEKFRILDLFTGVGPFGGWPKNNRNFQFCAKMLKKLGAKMHMIRGQRYWKMGRVSGLQGGPTPPPKGEFSVDKRN